MNDLPIFEIYQKRVYTTYSVRRYLCQVDIFVNRTMDVAVAMTLQNALLDGESIDTLRLRL